MKQGDILVSSWGYEQTNVDFGRIAEEGLVGGIVRESFAHVVF